MRPVYCSGSFLAVQFLRAPVLQVIEIETIGSCLEYRFRTTEGVYL
jgi:hypothetical protein